MFSLRTVLLFTVMLMSIAAGTANSQTGKLRELTKPGLQKPMKAMSPHSVKDLRRRLEDLDRQLMLRNLGRAEDLLQDLSQHSVLLRELVTREIRLAQLKGNHEEAIRLCKETLVEQFLNPSLWRYLAVSELAMGNVDGSYEAVAKFMATNANTRSASVVAVDLFRARGYHKVAVGLIDSMRGVLNEPRFLGRIRAVGLLILDEQAEAAAEVSLELRTNPYNLSLMRTELLEGFYIPAKHKKFLRVCKEKSMEPGRKPAEVLMVANLELAGGNDPEALMLVRSLLNDPTTAVTVLSNVTPMVRELPLLSNQEESTAITRYLLGVLKTMINESRMTLNLKKRVSRYLAMTSVVAMGNGTLGSTPDATIAQMGQYLNLVRAVNPSSEELYSAQISLVQYTRDHLGQPVVAARRLESMLMDLNLPNEGVALVRLTLGECYMAAGDTARGRMVLTRLGRDQNYHTAGGHAHFHLARLDLAEGHFATARDRLAVVAMDNPAAPYANEALELGLAIAEEMENPSGGPAVLALYARSVYFELVAKPEERMAALEHFVRYCTTTLDLEEDQHLLERGRMELARLLAEEGQYPAAITELQQIFKLHPRGRFPGESLALQGELYLAMGKTAKAGEVWQQLLVQYPDYLFIDDVRDQLRSLP